MSAFRSWQRNLFFLWLAQFLSMAAFSSTYTFIPFYFERMGLADVESRNFYVGLYAAVGNLGFAVFSPIWGKVADIYGRKIMLLRANFAAGMLIPLMGFISNPDVLVVHRLFLGILAGTVMATQTLALSSVPAHNRSFALGAIASAVFGGSMVGQLIGGFSVNAIGYMGTFFICGGLLVVAGLLVFIYVDENFQVVSNLREEWKKTEFRLPKFGRVWYILILFLAMSAAREFDSPFIPSLIHEIVPASDQALLWSGIIGGICCVAGILSGLVLGKLADMMPVFAVLAISIAVAGILRIPQGLSNSILMLTIVRFCMIFAAGGMEPLLNSWLAGVTPEKEHGSFLGWAASFRAVGWVVGGFCGGAAIKLTGNVRLVFFVAAMMYLLLIPILYLAKHKIPPRNLTRK